MDYEDLSGEFDDEPDSQTWTGKAAREIWGIACRGELSSEKQIREVIDKHMKYNNKDKGEIVILDLNSKEKQDAES